MSIIRHGLTIGIERVDNDFFLSLKATGKLTHADYEKINPMIDSALEGIKDPKIKAYIDGSDFEGWELRAAWDDIKLGLEHGSEFEKVAIFGTKTVARYLLQDCLKSGIEVSAFLDNDKMMIGKTFESLPTRNAINNASYRKIDAVLISVESPFDTTIKEDIQKTTENSMPIISWKELVDQINA